MSEVKVVNQDQLKKRQGKLKGRIVDPAARAEIAALRAQKTCLSSICTKFRINSATYQRSI